MNVINVGRGVERVKRWLAQFSIERKIVGLLGLGFCGFLLYFISNHSIFRENERLMASIVTEHLPTLQAAEALSVHLGAVKNSVAQSLISANMDSIGNLEAAHRRVEAAFTELNTLNPEHITDLKDAHDRYVLTHTGLADSLQNVVAGLESVAAIQGKLQTHTSELVRLEQWARDLKDAQTKELRASVDHASSGSRRAMWIGWALLLGAIPFVLFFLILARQVTRRLQTMSSRLTEVAQHVLRISNDTAVSSSRLASASGQQASAVTESVSSMEEMKTMLSQTVRHSAEALNSSEESFREAASGQTAVNDLRVAMRDIEKAYAQLEEVNQVVSSIRSKTNIINDIVFKTQLLSFNASIEAARAGQHGRGFSVVAAEVGKLAEMSGVAAQEIGKLLDQSSRKVSEIVESTKGKVGSANQMSQRCATVFDRITNRTGEVKSMVDAITSAAAEQESGIQQVSRAMIEMKQSADQNDHMSHDISQLSDSLKSQSQALASTVDRLEVLVHGTKGLPAQVHVLDFDLDSQEETKTSRSA